MVCVAACGLCLTTLQWSFLMRPRIARRLLTWPGRRRAACVTSDFGRTPHVATERMAGVLNECERQHAPCATNAFDG
eukprot:5086865-Pyramimonas_sp.AAC.1